MGLLFEQPWTRQPNASDYSALKLAGFVPPESVIALPGAKLVFSTGQPMSWKETSITPLVNLGATSISSAASAAARVELGLPLRVRADVGMTWVAVFNRGASTATSYVEGTVNTASSYIEDFLVNATGLEANSPGSCGIFLRSTVAQVLRYSGPTTTVAQDTLTCVVWQWSLATGATLYRNGEKLTATLDVGGYNDNLTGPTEFPITLCNRNARNAFSNNSALEVAFYARLPGIAFDGLSLSLNPYQLFAPQRFMLPNTAAATGIPVLSAANLTSITNTTAIPQVVLTF